MDKNEKLKILTYVYENVEKICDSVYHLMEVLNTAFDDPAFENALAEAVSVSYPFGEDLDSLDFKCIEWCWNVWNELGQIREELEKGVANHA